MIPRPPLISVIMPAYNAGRYLAESVASVQNQTFTHWELLLIDDASTDNTPQIAQALASADSRIKYHRVESLRKPSSVRNVGIGLAQGKYVAFLDADDLYEPEALAVYTEYFSKNPKSRAVYGQYVEIDESGYVKRSHYCAQPDQPSWRSLMSAKTHHQLQALALDKQLLIELGGFNEQILYSEDWAFYLQLLDTLAKEGELLEAVATPVFRYRVYASSISRDINRAFEVLKSMDSLFRWLSFESGLPKEALVFRSKFIASNYGYMIRTHFQHGHFSIVAAALLRSFFNADLTLGDWLKYCASVFKLPLQQAYQQLVKPKKQKLVSSAS